jgi:ferrous iron transport protein B
MMGLNGKAVLPMVLGLGCDTMATMTTRILDSRKERLIVMLLLALGVPCSAQLGVILGMLAALSPAMTFLWAGCIVLVIFAVGFLSSKIISGKGSDFVLELPPMRLPKLSNIGVKTLARIEWYLREAVPLFFLGTFVLFILDKLTLLSVIERGVSPVVVGFLGLPIKATEAFLVGFLRRDYGAAGLFNLFNDQIQSGSIAMETQIQIVVSMITITLFMPCIANFFMIIKEQGIKVAMAISLFILPFSILVAGSINYLLRWLLL